jgi:hypothetical protein
VVSIGHREHAVGVAVACRTEIDALEIDLIGAGLRAVSGKIVDYPIECRRLIKLQHFLSNLRMVTDEELAAANSSVAPAPIVADPDGPDSGLLSWSVVPGAA